MSDDDYWENAYESDEYKHWGFSYPSPELIALAAAVVPRRNAKVLDVGCGGGIDAIFMAHCGFRVIGVDISAAALRVAKKRAVDARVEVDLRKGNVLKLPINDESFDFVTDRGLFHLIEDHDRPKYASEVFRVPKNKGHVLIRGASTESSQDKFNPITKEAIARYFNSSNFRAGPLLLIPLFSVEGFIDAKDRNAAKMG